MGPRETAMAPTLASLETRRAHESRSSSREVSSRGSGPQRCTVPPKSFCAHLAQSPRGGRSHEPFAVRAARHAFHSMYFPLICGCRTVVIYIPPRKTRKKVPTFRPCCVSNGEGERERAIEPPPARKKLLGSLTTSDAHGPAGGQAGDHIRGQVWHEAMGKNCPGAPRPQRQAVQVQQSPPPLPTRLLSPRLQNLALCVC